MKIPRWLHGKALRLAVIWDPSIGIYSEGDVMTVAVPTLAQGEPRIRYNVRHVRGVDACRAPPKVTARQLRMVLGPRGRRCAVAMDPGRVFIGHLDPYQRSQQGNAHIAVARLLPDPAHGVIAARSSVLRRWRMIARYAGLDLDIFTAGPIALLAGLSTLSQTAREECGVMLVQYQGTRLLCLCRQSAIISSFPIVDCSLPALVTVAGEWQRKFQPKIRWGAVMGGSETARHEALLAITEAFACAPLSVSSEIPRWVSDLEASSHVSEEISIVSGIGLSSCG